MAGIGGKLPLTISSQNGYTLLKNVHDTIKQNLKKLLLTPIQSLTGFNKYLICLKKRDNVLEAKAGSGFF